MLFKFSRHQIPLVTILLIVTNVIVYLLQWSIEGSNTNIIVMLKWGGNFAPYTLGDQPWRLFTSIFLHYGIFHLLANMLALYSLGVSLEKQIGPAAYGILYLISGFFGGLVSVYWNLFVVSAGASGAIFGLFGFEIILQVIAFRKDLDKLAPVILQFVFYVGIITWLGNSFHFDNAAHIGGLVAGIMLALLYAYSVFKNHKPIYWASACALIFAGLIIYILMPRFQKQYFDVFQEMVRTERQATDIMNGDYGSDQVFLQDLKKFRPRWDSLNHNIEKIINIPDPVSPDYSQIKLYSQYKTDEFDYLIRMIEKESYTYYDSIDIIRSKLHLNLFYPLALGGTSTNPGPDSIPHENQYGEVVKQYYDSAWHETSVYNAMFYRLGYKDSIGRWNGPVRDYFLNGGIQMKGFYKDDLRNGVFIYYTKDSVYSAAGRYKNENRVGKWEQFHNNGLLAKETKYTDKSYLINAWDKNGKAQVVNGDGHIRELYNNDVTASFQTYADGLQDSVSYGYYKSGKPYFKEYYNKGNLIKGIAYAEGGEIFHYDIATYIPHPEGGTENYDRYIKDAKKQLSFDDGQSGVVELIFDIAQNGSIFNLRVLHNDDPGLNIYAKKIIKNGPRWIPAKEHGIKPVASEGYQLIRFP